MVLNYPINLNIQTVRRINVSGGGGEGTIRKIDFYAFLHLASVLYSYILNRVLFVNLNYLNSSFTLECCKDFVNSDEVGLSIH